MTLDELREGLVQFPKKYEEALRKQTEAIVEVKRLEFELGKIQTNLDKEENDNDILGEDTDQELIKLDTELEKLKLRLSEAESKVELEARILNSKATESHIKALVSDSENVSQLRIELIEAKAKIKTRKAEIQRKRSELWEKRRQVKSRVQSEDLLELENKVRLAKEQQFTAYDEVETLKVELETYRLLAGIVDGD